MGAVGEGGGATGDIYVGCILQWHIWALQGLTVRDRGWGGIYLVYRQ